MKKRSFSTRVVFYISTIFILVGAALVVAVFFQVRGALLDQKKIDLKEINRQQSQEIGQDFASAKFSIENIAKDDEIIKYLVDNHQPQDSAVLSMLENIRLSSDYQDLYLIDAQGKGLVSTNPDFVGLDLSFRDYFNNAKINGSATEYAIGLISNLPGYYISSAIKLEDGTFLGVAVARMDAPIVSSILQNNKEFGGQSMIVDEDGIILFSERKEREGMVLEKLSDETIAHINKDRTFPQASLESIQYIETMDAIRKYVEPSTIDFYDNGDGEDEVVGISKISNSSIFLLTEYETDQLSSPAIVVSVYIGVSIFLAIVVSGLLLFYSLHRALRPMKKLKEASEKMIRGARGVKVDVHSGDEFEELANSFNMMSERISQSQKVLEKEVAEKTKELNIQLKSSEKHNEILKESRQEVLKALEEAQSEKRRAERLTQDLEKFKMAVESTDDHIVITDSEGIVLHMNSAAEKITGFSVEESLGQKVGSKKLWGGQMDNDFYENLWKKIKEEKKPFIGEIKNKRKNGKLYDAFATINPIQDKHGEVRFFVAVERDITREKKIDKAKTEFVSLASHQLRTPLTSINWYLEMLIAGDAGKINKNQKEFLGEAYHGSQRMVELVNALLNVSRIDLGTFAVEPKLCNIIDLVKQEIKDLKLQLEEKKMTIETEFGENMPEINLDPNLMGIIIQNFLTNSIKYTPKKGKITVSVDKNDAELLMKFSDNGYGIPKEQQEKLFAKLFRADNIKDKETGGTGLGLYIVKSILHESGGKISFESEENKGTTFFVTLPLSGMKKKDGTRGLTAPKM